MARRPGRLGGAALLEATTWFARADAVVRRSASRGGRAIGAFLAGALSSDEISRLSARLYDVSGAGGREFSALLEWEGAWFGRRLPPPPARVLVAGAGSGREPMALVDRGYAVDAFEPSVRRGQECAGRVGSHGSVAIADFDSWSGTVLDGSPGPASALAGSYDAVLLGWGSLSHVLTAEAQQRVFEAANEVCPRGPVLASFLLGNGRPRELHSAERLVRAMGSAVGRARGAEPFEYSGEFALWQGFTYSYTRDGIEAIARSVGRRTLWDHEQGETPHATFVVG